MMATYGYGRVSRDSQEASTQKYAIEQALKMPVDDWYEDHAVSGTTKAATRPMFSKMIEQAVSGDVIVFSRVDRIARKTSDVLVTVENLIERGVNVYILQIGKTPLNSKDWVMQLTIYAMFAENERLAIVERTRESLARKKSEGVKLGPKLRIPPNHLRDMCIGRANGLTLDALSEQYKFDRNTIYRNVKAWGSNLEGYELEWNTRQAQYEKNAA
jgi:putative DNA-invertase from lambdoid prophage Rac